MAQHDYDIANDTAANVRADINDVLAAIVSNNSGASAPATTYANQWWYDSTNDILKIRNEADTAWIDFATINQTDGQIEFATLYADNVSDGTTSVGAGYVVNGSAKAWVNFQGIGTVSINDDLNFSSITDNGVGDYTVSYTNNISTTYAWNVGSYDSGGDATWTGVSSAAAPATSSIRVKTALGSTYAVNDADSVTVVIHGNLA